MGRALGIQLVLSSLTRRVSSRPIPMARALGTHARPVGLRRSHPLGEKKMRGSARTTLLLLSVDRRPVAMACTTRKGP